MRARTVRLFTLCALFGVAPLAAQAADLVVNGDFDNTDGTWVDNTGFGSDDLVDGGGMVPGWSSVPGLANDFWSTTPNNYALTNSPGNASAYWIDLTGQANDKPYGGIQQTIATQVGATYALKFDLGTSTTYDGAGLNAAAVDVVVSGNATLKSADYALVPITSNDWSSKTVVFTADSASTTISFTGDSAYTSRYAGLDNVSVTAVPEPASIALWLTGGGLLAAAVRRRSR